MAIEITKRGDAPHGKKYEAECIMCRTEFTFQEMDATLHYDGRDGNFYQVGCPVCGYSVARRAE